MPSSSDYTNRIIDEAHRVLDPRVSALQVAFESLRSHLLTSIEQLTPKLDAVKSVELPAAERIVSEAMKEAAFQNQVEVNLLAEFAAGMRRKETQEEILSLLLDTSHQFAHAVALFVARGDEIAGWSSRGFSPDSAARFGSCSFGPAESAFLRKALTSETIVSFEHPPDDARFQEIFQDEPLLSWHLLPMKALQRPIAILAACDANDRHSNLDSLRILIDFTSLCVENLALKILQEMRTTETAEHEPAARPPEPAVEPEPAAAAVAPVMSESRPEPTREEPPPPSRIPVAAEARVPEAEEEEIELLSEYSPEIQVSEETAEVIEPADLAVAAQEIAPAPEPVAPSGIRVSPAVAESPTSAKPAPAVAVAPPPSPPAPAPLSPEMEKLQSDARRFARLLVSEIKLYNEQRLLEARAGGQIYLRLKRDIDRSREMYEKRYPPSAACRADFFHDEVVRILADNDSAKLGAEYPGPRIES